MSDETEPTIAEDIVVTKYVAAGDIVNRKLSATSLVTDVERMVRECSRVRLYPIPRSPLFQPHVLSHPNSFHLFYYLLSSINYFFAFNFSRDSEGIAREVCRRSGRDLDL